MRDVWIALIAVGVGSVLTVFAQEVAHWLAKRRRRCSLALLVCPVLDRFIADCQAAIDDEGRWHASGTRSLSVPMPTGPEFPTEVDWTSINPKLANRILSLPLATIRADQEVSNLGDHPTPPEHEEAFVCFRRERCSKLQRDAVSLSSTLRRKAKLPPASDDPHGNTLRLATPPMANCPKRAHVLQAMESGSSNSVSGCVSLGGGSRGTRRKPKPRSLSYRSHRVPVSAARRCIPHSPQTAEPSSYSVPNPSQRSPQSAQLFRLSTRRWRLDWR